jgi:hypothetical protein
VIVSQRERSSIEPKYSVEDLPGCKDRAVDRTLSHYDSAPQPVGGVAHEDEHPFSAGTCQLGLGDSGDV